MIFKLYGFQISYSWPSQPSTPSLLPLTVSSSSTNTTSSSNSILAKYSCADRVSKYVQNLRQQQHQQQQPPERRRNSSSYIIPPPPPMLPLTPSQVGQSPRPRNGNNNNNNKSNNNNSNDKQRCCRSNWSDLSIAVMKLAQNCWKLLFFISLARAQHSIVPLFLLPLISCQPALMHCYVTHFFFL